MYFLDDRRGFGSAMNAFTGQNYGAKQYDRVKKSYGIAVLFIGIWGIITSCILIFGAEPISACLFRKRRFFPSEFIIL